MKASRLRPSARDADHAQLAGNTRAAKGWALYERRWCVQKTRYMKVPHATCLSAGMCGSAAITCSLSLSRTVKSLPVGTEKATHASSILHTKPQNEKRGAREELQVEVRNSDIEKLRLGESRPERKAQN
jgi:hypothetical protein